MLFFLCICFASHSLWLFHVTKVLHLVCVNLTCLISLSYNNSLQLQARNPLSCWSSKYFSVLLPLSFLLLSPGAWLCFWWYACTGPVSTPVTVIYYPEHMTMNLVSWSPLASPCHSFAAFPGLTVTGISAFLTESCDMEWWSWTWNLFLKQNRMGDNHRVWEITLYPSLNMKKH